MGGFPIKPVLERLPDKYFRGQVYRVALGNDTKGTAVVFASLYQDKEVRMRKIRQSKKILLEILSLIHLVYTTAAGSTKLFQAMHRLTKQMSILDLNQAARDCFAVARN